MSEFIPQKDYKLIEYTKDDKDNVYKNYILISKINALLKDT